MSGIGDGGQDPHRADEATSTPSSITKPNVDLKHRNIISRIQMPLRRKHESSEISSIEIYYGTMFGNAERFARSLAYEIMTKRRARVSVHDLDGFEQHSMLNPGQKLFVFVVSTHFAGAPSPSAERFRKWIEALSSQAEQIEVTDSARDQPTRPTPIKRNWITRFRHAHKVSLVHHRNRPLHGMKYTVFGIGDSIYLTFNAAAKFVDIKLKHLGASRYLAVGLGDCSGNLDDTFKTWQAALLRKIPVQARSPNSQG